MDRATKDFLKWFNNQVLKLRHNPYLLAAWASTILVILLGLLFSKDLICLMGSGINTWEDARGVGLFIGGVIASPIAFLSLHLGDRRIQEQERQNGQLIRQNESQNYETSISKLAQAFDLIDQKSEPKRILGLALLRQSELKNDRARLDATLSALRAFIERHAKPYIASKISSTKDEPETLKWNKPESSEALHSLLFLSSLRFVSSHAMSTAPRIQNVDFGRPLLERASFTPGAWFQNCSFRGAQFLSVKLDHLVFQDCDFSSARLMDCQLTKVEFKGCGISSLVAISDNPESNDPKLYTSLLSDCTYLADKPPHVPVGTLLPVPYVMDEKNNVPCRKMTSNEARRWGDPRFIPKFNESGELLGMEYTGSKPPIDQPKPDPGPPLTPS